MREYGGYIEFEYFHGKEFHKNAIALNSGCRCVEYLIKARDIKKLFLPYFMCDSVRGVCDKLGVEIEFYHIDLHFFPLFNQILQDGEWLYVVNYYGQLINEKIRKLRESYNNIIVDNVQAFFQMPIDGVDTLYSCRKFFGVADGAYLYTEKKSDVVLEKDYSYDRMSFLFGRMEKSANEFYSEYVSNNKRLKQEGMKAMSKVTKNILCGIDYAWVRNVRTLNYEYLHKRLRKYNRLELIIPEGAFMYPLYIEDGVEIRKRLQQNKIYIPTLWPNVFDICQELDLEYDMAENIFPIPIDQRYSLEDMKYIANVIDTALESLKEA